MPRKSKQARPQWKKDVAQELRIAKEAQFGWVRLDSCELREVPEDVFDMKHLENLDLSENLLKTVPESLWDLPSFRDVTLIGNPIERLPNRKGLIIDLPIYRRVRNQVDAKNITLVIHPDNSEEEVSEFCQY